MNHFVLILLLVAFPALSTDMYLPAIPSLCTMWGITMTHANLSLVAFFLTFSAFLLVHGPLSDTKGRRPVLIWGISLYVVGSLLCALSPGITVLIIARSVQAVGAAGASAVGLALVKDLYEGEARKKLLAYVGVIVPLCPMIAPSLGAFMLQAFSWRGIFLSQAILALPALYGSFRLQEPLMNPEPGGVRDAMRRYARLSRNMSFMFYCIAFAVAAFAFFCFIGGSADIYINGFGLSEQTYGLYFALNAFGLMLGSFLCSRLCVHVESHHLLILSFAGMFASAAGIHFFAGPSPLSFALPMFFFTMFLGLSRPISNHVILEQVTRDTGTAASVITFSFFLVGAVAMEVITLGWDSKPLFVAQSGMAGALVPLFLLLFIPKRHRG